jgi:hypothetical protein
VAATDVGTSAKFIEPVTLPSAGTYTIVVDPQGANTGGITLGLSNPAADTTATITAGGAGVVFTASNAGQNGSLTFTGSVNQRISIKFSSVTIGSNPISGTQVTLLQPNGKALGAVTPVGTNGAFVDTTTLPTAGTYTIKINPQAALTGSATVNLYTVTADATATLPTNGTPTVSTNTTPGQNMKLTFAGTANQNVSLAITSVTIGSQPNAGTTVTILKPNGTTLTLLGVGTSGGYVDTTKLPTTGTYTIKIDPQGANTGSATFKLNIVPADTTTTVTRNAGATSATNTVPGQNAKVTFTGTAGDLDTITTGPSQCCTITVKVLKPDGTTLASAFFTGDNSLSLPALPTTGTYTIVIDYYREATGTTPLELIG